MSHGFEARITQSDVYSVAVTADDNLFDNLEIRVQDNTLKIRLDPAFSYLTATKKAHITMPDLYSVKLSTGSRGTVTGFESSHEFTADLSTGSHLHGDLESQNIYIITSLGSTITLEGSAYEMMLQGSSGSSADLGQFIVTDGIVNLSVGSRATINVNGKLGVHLDSGSTLYYTGEPDFGTISISSGSQMKRR